MVAGSEQALLGSADVQAGAPILIFLDDRGLSPSWPARMAATYPPGRNRYYDINCP